MARVILALEIDEDEGFYNETSTGTVLGYLEPIVDHIYLPSDKLYRLVAETDEMIAT